MNENERTEELAASLSLSLFASQMVMALDDFLTMRKKPEALGSLCAVAQKSFCLSATAKQEVFDPTSTGLLASPEQFRLLPEAIMHTTEGTQDVSKFIAQLQSDLDRIRTATNCRVTATSEAARRLQRFFDALGDLALDESRRDVLLEHDETEATTWTMPSLIG